MAEPNEESHEDGDEVHGGDAGEGRTARVFARLTASDVHQAVKALPSKAQQQLARTVGVPITVLTSAGSAADLVRRRARRSDVAKASALGRDLAEACTADTIVALGDRHDDPSYEDLLGVLGPICDRWGVRLVALMLAATADGDFNARNVCARLLEEDARFDLDALGAEQSEVSASAIAAAPSSLSEAEVEAKRLERRQRREAKKSKQPTKRVEPRSYRRARREPVPSTRDAKLRDPSHPVPPPSSDRRRVTVVGNYDDLDYDDELVGAVVPAFVRFRDSGAVVEEGKTRPCVVIAACAPDSLVVRPCYSEGGVQAGDWRSVRVTDPASAGLDKGSYVSTEEVVVARADAVPVLGRLARADWNAL